MRFSTDPNRGLWTVKVGQTGGGNTSHFPPPQTHTVITAREEPGLQVVEVAQPACDPDSTARTDNTNRQPGAAAEHTTESTQCRTAPRHDVATVVCVSKDLFRDATGTVPVPVSGSEKAGDKQNALDAVL